MAEIDCPVPDSIYTSRAKSNIPVHFPGTAEENLIGKIVPVMITEGKTFYQTGKKISE